MEPITSQRPASAYTLPKAGLHRARSKSDLTVSELESKTSRAKRFLERVYEMDHDLAEIKARTLIHMSPRKGTDNTSSRIAFLQSKLQKMRDKNYLAPPDLIENLERIKKLSGNLYSDAEYKSVLRAQIDYVSESLGKGILYNEDCQGHRSDLLDYVNALAFLDKGMELLRDDSKLFLQYSTAQIISLSKKLSLAYPRVDSHETQFTQLIETIMSFHAKKESISLKEMNDLIKNLIGLNESVQHHFEATSDTIQRELSELYKPDPNQDFTFTNIGRNSLFFEQSLIDDPAKEERRKALNSVLNEIAKSEEIFNQRVAAVSNCHLFSALAKENIITPEELDCLRKGWSELQFSSSQLHSMLILKGKTDTDSLVYKYERFLGTFIPQYIDPQMENCKTVMCHFMKCNAIIKKIQADPKGQQMLFGFSATQRLDIIDIWIMPVQRPPRYILLAKEVFKIMQPEGKAVELRIGYLEKWLKAINFYAPDFSK